MPNKFISVSRVTITSISKLFKPMGVINSRKRRGGFVCICMSALSGGGGVGSICMIGKKGKDRSQAMILVWARAFLNRSTLGEGVKDIFCMTSGSLSPILILRRSCSVGPSAKASPKFF